jgi:hypothetical protein
MKRGAEKQLSKDDDPDDQVEVRSVILNFSRVRLSYMQAGSPNWFSTG